MHQITKLTILHSEVIFVTFYNYAQFFQNKNSCMKCLKSGSKIGEQNWGINKEGANNLTFIQDFFPATFSMCHPIMYVITGLHPLMKTSLHLEGIMFEHVAASCSPPCFQFWTRWCICCTFRTRTFCMHYCAFSWL